MSAAQYFDVQTGSAEGAPTFSPILPEALGARKQTGAVNRQGQIKPVTVNLEEVMFTGRVPVSP